MFKRLVLVLMLVTVFTLSACSITSIEGSGNIVTEDRNVSGFDAIELSGAGELRITQGDEDSLSIETDDNLLQYIESYTSGSTLVIEFDQDKLGNTEFPKPTESIIYHITVKELTDLDVSGAAKVTLTDGLTADDFKVVISGAADANLTDLDVNTLTLEMSGAGNITVTGKADKQTVVMSGLGGYDASGLKTGRTSFEMSGGGTAEVWALDVLELTLSGAGSIDYYGNPQVKQDISGAGAIHSRGEK